MKISWYGTGLNATLKDRGLSYYRHNQVHVDSIEVTEEAKVRFQAHVVGTSTYQTSVDISETGMVSNMSCSCPYAGGGNSCKHIAALLYHAFYWNVPKTMFQQLNSQRYLAQELARQKKEEEKRLAEEERKRKEEEYYAIRTPIHPFQRGKNAPYRYFDFDAITDSFIIFDKDYEEAQRLAKQHPVRENEIQYGHSRETVAEGLVCYMNNYQLASVVIMRNQIDQMRCHMVRCRCNSYGSYDSRQEKKALCPGVLGSLIQMQNWIEANQNRGDATSYYAHQMLDLFLKKVNREKSSMTSVARPIQLEPTLQEIDGLLSLSWKIGTEKLYVVKNLTDLVQAVQNQESFQLGKNNTLQFDRDYFDETSEKYYAMIEDAIQQNKEINLRQKQRNWYTYSNQTLPDIKATLPLFGNQLDSFFDLAPHAGLFFQQSRGNGYKTQYRLLMTETDPEPKLILNQIVDSNGVFHGVRLRGAMPELIPGAQYQYTLQVEKDTASLNRVSPEGVERLLPFRKLCQGGVLDITVGRDHLSEFYYSVLPELKKLAWVGEPDADQILEHLPPQAEFNIYLDAENKVPMARVSVTYGETVVSLLDWQIPSFVRQDFRSVSAEQEAQDLISKYFRHMEPLKDLYRCEDSSEAILKLLDTGLSEMTAFCPVHSTPAFDALRFRRLPPVHVGVSLSDGTLLDLTIHSDELSQEELLEILDSYRQKKIYHRLRDGSWIKLDQDVMELSLLMEALHVTPKEFVAEKMHIPAYRALYLDKMLEQMDHFYTSRDQRFRKMIKEFKTVSDSDFEVPKSLEKILRPYQVYGYKWLRTLAEYGFGGILADDMGLGKTLQMIAVLLSAKESGQAMPSLIVCPASLVYNWQEECSRFAPELKTCAVAGTKTERGMMLKHLDEYDVLITSYDLLKRDILLYSDLQFNYQVLDEAQFIKTQTTAAAKSVRLIHAHHRFALTGTPIENRLSELWSIFDFLMPGYLYEYENFKRQMETPIAKTQDPETSARLQKMISPFVLRRLKSDVLKDLPDKLEEVRYVRFEGEQQRLYDAQATKIRSMLEESSDEDVNRNRIQILSQLTRIRQICCDPSLLFEDYQAASAKREACLDLIRSAMDAGHRILVFSQFTSMLNLLEQDLTDAGIDWYTITGATPKQERVNQVRKFNEGDTPVFLISLKAGGTGLNLTGADTVIHYDPWWNVAAQNQATDRAHRIGQTRTVCVYKLIGKETIEEKILKMQQDKQDLADEILSGEGRNISAMTREELMDLLG